MAARGGRGGGEPTGGKAHGSELAPYGGESQISLNGCEPECLGQVADHALA